MGVTPITPLPYPFVVCDVIDDSSKNTNRTFSFLSSSTKYDQIALDNTAPKVFRAGGENASFLYDILCFDKKLLIVRILNLTVFSP